MASHADVAQTAVNQTFALFFPEQRKFFLREQLKAIQQELGIAKDDRTADVDRFRERLEGWSEPEKQDLDCVPLTQDRSQMFRR